MRDTRHAIASDRSHLLWARKRLRTTVDAPTDSSPAAMKGVAHHPVMCLSLRLGSSRRPSRGRWPAVNVCGEACGRHLGVAAGL